MKPFTSLMLHILFQEQFSNILPFGNMWKNLEHGKGIYVLWQRLIRLSLALRGPGLSILMDL